MMHHTPPWHAPFGCMVASMSLVWFAVSCGCAAVANPPQVGHPHAVDYLAVADAEMKAGLQRRDVEDRLERYHVQIDKLMDGSAFGRKWQDKTGNCRLRWVDHLIRRPMVGFGEAEQFTRQLHVSALDEHYGTARVLAHAAVRLDLKPTQRKHLPPPGSVQQALDRVIRAIAESSSAFADAIKPLDASESGVLAEHLYAVSTGDVTHGARFADATIGRQVTDALEHMDRDALHDSAAALAVLTDPKLLQQLGRLKPGIVKSDNIIIFISGKGDDEHRLDEMENVAVVIDLGGNDTYFEGVVSADRPVLVVIDLGGDDRYRGEKPGIQGGAVMGVSMLIDVAGNDRYEAKDVSQGSCLAGAGILIDFKGDDSYKGLRRTQGHALGGVGLLIDRAGNDRYRGALLAQGVGGPLGFGMIDDLSGDDHFYAGGLYPDVYDDTPGYSGWSQGMGVGPRGVANGGIGVLLDGAGNDVYECDYFSHAGSYWFAAGFARDFAGNDRRLGATRTAYDGGPRKQKIFLRWGLAFGCHFGVGFLFDDAGDDFYGGTTVGTAFAWDWGVTGLFDFAGNDQYEIPGSGSGYTSMCGVALLFDAAGEDRYRMATTGLADPGTGKHIDFPNIGNFAFGIDYAGNDRYGGKTINNFYKQHGALTGFSIDRPALPDKAQIGKNPIEPAAGSEPSGTGGE